MFAVSLEKFPFAVLININVDYCDSLQRNCIFICIESFFCTCTIVALDEKCLYENATFTSIKTRMTIQ